MGLVVGVLGMMAGVMGLGVGVMWVVVGSKGVGNGVGVGGIVDEEDKVLAAEVVTGSQTPPSDPLASA